MVQLLVFDVGHTLGEFSGSGATEVLTDLSSLPQQAVAEKVRHVLHCAPTLTEELIRDLCDDLLIDSNQWPHTWPESRFTAYDYTPSILAQLSDIAPMVTLSNVSVIHGPQRMADLRHQCGDYLTAIYTSHELRARKPARRLWHYIADTHHVPINQVVHIGDQWHNDVLGALAVGARAVFLTGTRPHRGGDFPLAGWATTPKLLVVEDLQGVPAAMKRWIE